MGFEFFKNQKGNILPNSSINIKLISKYRRLSDYSEKMAFWDENQLQHINYVLQDMTENDDTTFIQGSNFTIDPKGRAEWVRYYEWQRDKRYENLKIEFEATLQKFKLQTQKDEYRTQYLHDIEDKLKILNNNPVYNERRDTKYGYDCEVKGQTPFRKHFNIQSDIATINGGVLYHLKHFVRNYDFSIGNDTALRFSEIFYNKSVELKTIELFKELKVIDANCNFIYESKGFWGVWLDYCLTKGLVKKMTKVKYRNILVHQFKGLKLTDKFTEYPSKTSIENSYSQLDKKTLLVEFTAKYSTELHR